MKTDSEKLLNKSIQTYNEHWKSEIEWLREPENAKRNNIFI